MKKIGLIFLVTILCGCTQTIQDKQMTTNHHSQQSITAALDEKGIMEKIQKTMPEEIYQELKSHQCVQQVEDTITIGNDTQEPTLRIDLTYQKDQLVQFTVKEYGFTEQMTAQPVSEEEAKQTVQKFAEVFFNHKVTLQKTTAMSGYDTKSYLTLQDEDHHLYLINMHLNTVLKYESDNV